MSSNVDREWFYFIKGRNLLLYQLLGGSSNERITQSGVMKTRGKELMYPNEDIVDGLRIEYTAFDELFITKALEAVTAKITDDDFSFNAITPPCIRQNSYVANSLVDAGFARPGVSGAAEYKIRVIGSASNDGEYTVTSLDANGFDMNLTTGTDTIVAESAGELITIYEIPSEDTSSDEESHVNLNRMQSLAVVDYIKAMLSEVEGEIDKKEYYMKEFFGKLGDNESNKRNISITFPTQPFAIR